MIKRPSQFPRAQGDVFKCLILSIQQSDTEPMAWQVYDGQAHVYVGHTWLIYSSSLHKNRWKRTQMFLCPVMQDFLFPGH